MTDATRSRTSTLQQVLEAIAGEIGTTAAQLDADVSLASLPGMESILMLRAIAALEEGNGIQIPDDVLFEVTTARELAAVIAELAAEQR